MADTLLITLKERAKALEAECLALSADIENPYVTTTVVLKERLSTAGALLVTYKVLQQDAITAYNAAQVELSTFVNQFVDTHDRDARLNKKSKVWWKSMTSELRYKYDKAAFVAHAPEYRIGQLQAALKKRIEDDRTREESAIYPQKRNSVLKAIETLGGDMAAAGCMDLDNAMQYAKVLIIQAAEHDRMTLRVRCCDTCVEYTVGEHRCSCGNRRISLEVDQAFTNLHVFEQFLIAECY